MLGGHLYADGSQLDTPVPFPAEEIMEVLSLCQSSSFAHYPPNRKSDA